MSSFAAGRLSLRATTSSTTERCRPAFVLALLALLGGSAAAEPHESRSERRTRLDTRIAAPRVRVQKSPDLFLKAFPLLLSPRWVASTNRRMPLNPIPDDWSRTLDFGELGRFVQHATYARSRIVDGAPTVSADVQNAINVNFVDHRGARQAVVALRKQARTPEAARRRTGGELAVGPEDFVWSETVGGSMEVKRGHLQTAHENLRAESIEEAAIDVDDYKVFELTQVPIAPTHNAGMAALFTNFSEKPLATYRERMQREAEELAELGSVLKPNVPFDRAIRYLQSGHVFDGRTALLLLGTAYKFGDRIPLSKELSRWPDAGRVEQLARDFEDTDDVPHVMLRPLTSAYRVQRPGDAQKEWRSAGTDWLASVAFYIGEQAPLHKEPFLHNIWIRPDQVAELPLLRQGEDLYVGLVPTVGLGMLTRRQPNVLRGLPEAASVDDSLVHYRGLYRDIERYERVDRGDPRAGNLGVMPRYEGKVAGAYAALEELGVHRTAEVINLGNFNPSVGEELARINLTAREVALDDGLTPEQINARAGGAIEFVKLEDAVEAAFARPHKVDQMTVVQLLLLGLREQKLFNFVDKGDDGYASELARELASMIDDR